MHIKIINLSYIYIYVYVILFYKSIYTCILLKIFFKLNRREEFLIKFKYKWSGVSQIFPLSNSDFK